RIGSSSCMQPYRARICSSPGIVSTRNIRHWFQRWQKRAVAPLMMTPVEGMARIVVEIDLHLRLLHRVTFLLGRIDYGTLHKVIPVWWLRQQCGHTQESTAKS